MARKPVPPMETIRLAWWSGHSLPLLILALLHTWLLTLGVARPDWWRVGLSAAVWSGLFARRVLTPHIRLGRTWVQVPATGYWNVAVGHMQSAGIGLTDVALLNEEDLLAGRLVRLADVESWSRSGMDVHLVLKGGARRTFSLRGISAADRERVLAYLVERLGG